MNLSKILLFLTILFISSCSTTVVYKDEQEAKTTDSNPVAPILSPSPKPIITVNKLPSSVIIYNESTKKENIYYKSFLLPKEDIGNKFANFIYFPRKPLTEKEVNKYMFICKLWLNSFPKESEVKPYIDDTKDRLIPIYWFLTKQVKSEKCEDLITNYDYVRAQMFVNRNGLNKNKIQILGQYDNVIVSMNLSSIYKEEDLILAFDVWKSKLSTVPEKSSDIEIFGIVSSTKKVLGVLGGIMLSKFKG